MPTGDNLSMDTSLLASHGDSPKRFGRMALTQVDDDDDWLRIYRQTRLVLKWRWMMLEDTEAWEKLTPRFAVV